MSGESAKNRILDRVGLMRMGARMKNSIEEGCSRSDVVAATSNSSRLVQVVKPGSARLLNGGYNLDGTLCLTALDWCEQGFPALVPSARLASSLMCTNIPFESATEVKLPWQTFAILLQSGPGAITKGNATLDTVIVTQTDSGISIFGFYSNGALSHHHKVSVAAMIRDAEFDDEIMLTPHKSEAEQSSRVIGLVSNLIANLCVEIDEPKTREVIRLGPPPKKSVRRKEGHPTVWTFQLSRIVKIDCREWVTQYLSGASGHRHTVQTLVRGHYKRQPYGPNSSLRKWIYREPFWKGPEDAPIATRLHAVDPTKDGFVERMQKASNFESLNEH